jgi:hypothetical protein
MWGALPGGRCLSPGWARVVCIRNIFILNEIWTQNKIYSVRLLAWLKYFTYHSGPVLAPNYKQHILSPAEVRKLYSLLTELYIKPVYLNLFGWRGREVNEIF